VSSSPATPASSPTRLEELGPDQLAALKAAREQWNLTRFSTAPVDRDKAERAVRAAYQLAGLSPPGRVEWCEGPVDLARRWERARRAASTGQNIRADLIDRQRALVDRRLQSSILPRVRAQLFTAEPPSRQLEALGVAVLRAVSQGVNEARSIPGNGARSRLLDLFRSLRAMRLRLRNWTLLDRSGVGQHQLGWLTTYRFMRDNCGLADDVAPLSGLIDLADNIGWLVPHEHHCWLAERHNALSHDANGRLHSAKGPALAYPDGWTFHAWKGIPVPADIIERPAGITLERIDQERNIFVRRCMIEIVTPAQFVAMGGASCINEDETGILWHKAWWTGDAWSAVEVINGTPEPDGTHRHYFLQVPPELRSARAAVAWTYGMSEQQYMRLGLRT
jgi:hypothetical protein